MSDKKITVLDVKKAKEEGRPLTMCTAYDYPSSPMTTIPRESPTRTMSIPA